MRRLVRRTCASSRRRAKAAGPDTESQLDIAGKGRADHDSDHQTLFRPGRGRGRPQGRRKRLGQPGPKVAEFERVVAGYCGTAEAVAVSNCTTALHLRTGTLGIGRATKVICPSMSFIATANSIRYTGATPVFADVDPQTYNLDPDAAEAAITPRTKAIMVVHQIGLPVDIDRFLAIGQRHGVKILEDAACAIGSRYKGRPIGGHTRNGLLQLPSPQGHHDRRGRA